MTQRVLVFNGKNIFITGGTGSFGKKYTEILLKNYKPNKIIIYSRDELKQYEMAQQFTDPCMRFFIGDVRDVERLKSAMYGAFMLQHSSTFLLLNITQWNVLKQTQIAS